MTTACEIFHECLTDVITRFMRYFMNAHEAVDGIQLMAGVHGTRDSETAQQVKIFKLFVVHGEKNDHEMIMRYRLRPSASTS